jgi:hypothetical protein
MIRIRRKPSPALIVAILALIVAMAGGAYAAAVPKNSVGSKQLKKNAVKSGKIVNGAVTSGKIAGKAVTSGKFFLSASSNQNLGNIAGGDCTTLDIPTPGIQATDHVLGTPPPGFTDTFGLVADPNPTGGAVSLQICNLFQGGGSADPDGGGGPYKVLVIR